MRVAHLVRHLVSGCGGSRGLGLPVANKFLLFFFKFHSGKDVDALPMAGGISWAFPSRFFLHSHTPIAIIVH